MKIKLSSIYASHDRTAQPGEIIDVSDEEGKALIDGRYGVEFKETAKPAPAPAETADDDSADAEDASDSAPETAATPQRRGGRRPAKPAPAPAETAS